MKPWLKHRWARGLCRVLPVAVTLSITGHAASGIPINTLARLEPTEGCFVGVNLGARDTIESFSFRMGWRPAVCGEFFEFPLNADSRRQITKFVQEVRATGGIALITLTPNGGLNDVSEDVCADLAQFCSDQEAQGNEGILVRFAHEMNGNWYAWGQQPVAYRQKFRLLAGQIHARTTRTAMMWAPSYGGGYPFKADQLQPSPLDFAELDTDGDGILTGNDDCYEPYYPGDDAVDWVGLTVYHWGTQYPWLENELPEPNCFAHFVTGEYVGGNGDQTAVPDFYGRYCAGQPRAKPLAIPETAAFFNPHQGGALELDIKKAWFGQVFNIEGDRADAVDVAQRFPRLKCISWFDHYKLESEIGQWIDWRVSGYEPVRAAFLDAVGALRGGRPWFLGAGNIKGFQQDYAIALLGIPSVLPLAGVFTISCFVTARTPCDLVINLVDADSVKHGEARARIQVGDQWLAVPVAINAAVLDGALYRCNAYLIPLNSDSGHALAVFQGVPQAAREITPAIRIVAAPAVFASGTNTVRVQYAVNESAVAAVNLLDSGNQIQGGGSVKVDRGNRLLDIPIVLAPGVKNGRYTLVSFLSDSAANWQQPIARGEDKLVEVRTERDKDVIRAVVEPSMVRAGEVFRFIVEYAASTNRDLHIDLFDAQTNVLAGASQPVAAGSGIRDMTLSFPIAPPGDYFITAFITPSGRPWTEAAAWSPDQGVKVLPAEYFDWLQAYWGVPLCTDRIGPEDDPDGDGMTNMTEFKAGTDPRRSDTFPVGITRSQGGCVVVWPSVVGQRYKLLQTADVKRGPWTPVSDVINGTGSLLQTVAKLQGGARFFRVQTVP